MVVTVRALQHVRIKKPGVKYLTDLCHATDLHEGRWAMTTGSTTTTTWQTFVHSAGERSKTEVWIIEREFYRKTKAEANRTYH